MYRKRFEINRTWSYSGNGTSEAEYAPGRPWFTYVGNSATNDSAYLSSNIFYEDQ